MTQPAAPFVPNTGSEFEDEDVVRAYAHRTPYPPALIGRLLQIAPGRGRALDLGCGPGKLARSLAAHFGEVLAVDPSPAMLRLGQALDGGTHSNIAWIKASGEAAVLDPPLDLAVAGASIHWMHPARVFPKLARALSPGAPLALIGGDGPAEAPWIAAWQDSIKAWVERLGGRWNDAAHCARTTAHEPWLEVEGRETFEAQATQAVDELIEAEHSRATWARAKMGGWAEAFDADLRAVLAPHARDGP